MRNLVLFLTLSLVSYGVMAQKRSELRGPAYKNYKPWLNKSEPLTVYSFSKKENLTGPAFKNQKPWNKNKTVKYTSVVVGSERSKLMGPAYKNYKPWNKIRR
ncbi:hypothetical protein [Aestuariivivens sediminis]|uniref:hypothetical protein n=1 Tax=Aestuariivivens sediminis TaxID=2913557 RepID=UPI001F5A10C5|nr:hypothetical protein [Aestuariivivens sediminis]